MKITAVRIFPFDTASRGGNIRAIADVELDNTLLIKGIRILETRSGGLFLGMPSTRLKDGSYRDWVILTDKTFAEDFRNQIMEAYRHADRIHITGMEENDG